MPTFEIKMPKLGESITEGIITSWSVKVGDIVNENDVLLEINTAKVSAEIPSPVSGKILEILFKEGDTVAVGTVLAIIQLEDENEEQESKPTIDKSTEIEPKSKPVNQKLSKTEDSRWYSPVVLSRAKESGINTEELDTISGTGYLGRLTKQDIENYIKNKGAEKSFLFSSQELENKTIATNDKIQPPSSVTTNKEDEVIPMDAVRRIIADRMVASKKISPHVTNVIEADVTRLVKWREKNKEEFRRKEGLNLTYMPAITEAVTKALEEYPRVNSSVDGYNIIQKKQINIGVAVSLNDGNLIVPVIKNANKLNFTGLASDIALLADKARQNKLVPDEIQGGTFTITNFGSFKSLFGTPIINQPEVAILGLGVIEKKPAVIETTEGDVISIRHKMYLSLSYDHRVIDGALGGSFLKYIAEYLENWKY